MTGKNTRLRFEDASGRLIELISYSDNREGAVRKEIATARWEKDALVAFARLHAALRASSTASLEQVLPAAAQAAWDGGFRERIDALLAELELTDAAPAAITSTGVKLP